MRRDEFHKREEFHTGERVRWDAGNESSIGRIERKLTEDTVTGGRTIRAGKDDPCYLVRSERTGRVAAQPPHALSRMA